MNRFLLALGTNECIIASLLWRWLKRIPLFHLPGDILFDRPGFKFLLPSTLSAQYPLPASSGWPLPLKRRWCRQPGQMVALSGTVALQCGHTRVTPGEPVRPVFSY